MELGQSWTNGYGEQVVVTERGLSVRGHARNAVPPRTIEASPFAPPVPYFVVAEQAAPRTPRITKGSDEPAFAPVVPYYEQSK